MTLRSIGLFVLAALFEIGGAWLVWQIVREHRAWWLAGLGVIALGLYVDEHVRVAVRDRASMRRFVAALAEVLG